MNTSCKARLQGALDAIQAAGLLKTERVISTPQGSRVAVAGGPPVLNFCANNYLGLADNPDVIAAAKTALDRWGYGLASVRFICGTQGIHRELEERLSAFLGAEDTILYSSCFDANAGVFEALLGEGDAVISDALNHASIIDGIRLCKAQRYRYRNCDMADLEARLAEADAAGAGIKLIVTDGIFSMDGSAAPLARICDLAERTGALVMIDDSHAVGFVGRTGRGTPEATGTAGRIDIISGTLGKALGGASGGFIAARREIVAILRQKSRPYLFSNSLAPSIAAASITALDLVGKSTALRDRLEENTARFRAGLARAGLAIKPGTHPIVPIMLGDAVLAQRFAARMLEKGVYVVGFFFPVVPRGEARIRAQVSAAHTAADIDFAIAAFAEVKQELCP